MSTALLSLVPLLMASGDQQTIVFVCEYGSAKSVLAAAEFNRASEEAKLPFRAISRAINPDHQAVKPPVRAGMEKDGLPIPKELPKRLSADEVADALRVIAFNPVPKELAIKKVDEWTDIPPVTEQYEKARAAIAHHVRALLEELRKADL